MFLIESKTQPKGEGKGEYYKPKFTNSKGVQNREGEPIRYEKREKYDTTKKSDGPKKFVNTSLLNKAAEENSKFKAPTKDYNEAVTSKYKEDVDIEKPRFLNKNEGNEPHFKEINKNEDV